MPAEWLMTNVSMDSSFAGFDLGDEVGDRLVLRIEVQQHADVTELEGAVDHDDLLAELGDRRDGHVDRDGGLADPALRAEDRDDHARLAGAGPCVAVPLLDAGAATGAIRLCLSRSRVWTWRMEVVSSSLLNGLTRNSRAPASIDRRR